VNGILLRVSVSPWLISSLSISAQPPPSPPIIVKIIQPARDPIGLARIIFQAIGFTGAVTLLAVLLGLVLAGVMVWIRSRD
jgi:hypothetical protein